KACGARHNRVLHAWLENDELSPGSAESELRAVGGKGPQPDIVAVEAESAVGVGDRQLDGSHAGLGGYRLGLHRIISPTQIAPVPFRRLNPPHPGAPPALRATSHEWGRVGLAEADDLPLFVDVDAHRVGGCGEAWHRAHLAADRIDETGAHGRAHLSHREHPAR